MQQQVVMPQNLNLAHFGHPGDVPSLSLPQQQDISAFPVPTFPPQIDMNSPASAPLHSQGFSFDGSSTEDVAHENYKLVTLDVLKSMLPDSYEERPRAGLLPDGQAYAPGPPQAKNQYLLFSSKSAYIAYYIKFYFSETNLSRDNYILGLMVDGNCLPVSKLIEFPRLVAVHATVQDVEAAVANNKLLEIVKNPSVGACVRRIDGIPIGNRPDVMSAPPSVTMSPDSFSALSVSPGAQNGFEGATAFVANPAVTKNNSNSSVGLMWPAPQQQGLMSPSYVYQQQPSEQQQQVVSQAPSGGQGTSPRAPPNMALPGAPQFIASPSQSQQQQAYNGVVLAMNALNFTGPTGQQLRYFAQPQTTVGNAAAGVQPDFYQTAPSHQQLFLVNPQTMMLATHPFAFSQQGQAGAAPQQQVLGHHGIMAPPGMISLQQQQQALHALQQQQQFVAMQQGFVANPLGQYNVNLASHHQMLQQHAASTMVPGAPGNTTGPPPGLAQPITHWTPMAPSSGTMFSPPLPPQPQQQQQMQQQQQPQQNSSPPGMPKPAAESAGTPIPAATQVMHARAPSNAAAVTTAIPAVNSSSGRSSSSGIASGVSSQNSSSVVAVSSGSSSSVSSSSTTSGMDVTSGKHPYAAVVAKAGPKPEEVSVAKLGGGPTPGGPQPQPMYHQSHRGNKAGGGFFRPKMNNGGSFEENNNHGSYGGGSWRGGHHRGGSGMRGSRGGGYNNGSGHYMQQQQQQQGSYNQVASGSAPRISSGDGVSGQGGPQGKREVPAAPLVQEG